GVRQVDNQLAVNAEAGTGDKARDKADQAGAASSDAWIRSKAKSSFLLNKSLEGLDISVDTKGGQVTLGGRVATSAEKDLAIESAEDMRGVQGVNADSLQVGNEG